MINRTEFVQAAKKLLITLEDDLRTRAELDPFREKFKAEYAQAHEKGRTGQDYASWLDERLTQVGAAWILACVFLRFLEDNDFLSAPLLAGPGDRLKRATENRETYFRSNPTHSDREFLEHLFVDLAKLPAMKELLDQETNPLWQMGPSADGAHALVDFFRAINPDSGQVRWDFTDESADTRFLGDLYQDLSEAARKRYALLQTPDFVEEFILDRTLEPAIKEFGLEHTTLIDPTCGSGHFLLGAFARLLAHWDQRDAATTPAMRVQRVLDAIAGVDVNPFAIAIARFRLLLAALRAADCRRLADAPDFHFHLAAGDSLLHGNRPGALGQREHSLFDDDLDQVYEVEDKAALRQILNRRYSAVVGNPPYITPKDKALRDAYRARYGSCHMKYALSVPFMERFFDLATPENEEECAGFVGKITSNSFMKREFGRELIVEYFKRWELSHVIDTSGAYIPGHGTPTVILFGRARKPVVPTIRAVLGIRGEPATPEDPSQGLVWHSIVEQVDHAGSEGTYVSVQDMDRATFHAHPWSIGGGGAAELKERIEESASTALGAVADAIGITSVTGEDDLYMLGDRQTSRRLGIEQTKPLVVGDLIRDWGFAPAGPAAWTYDSKCNVIDLDSGSALGRFLWKARTNLRQRRRFGTPMVEKGFRWYEWQELYASKLRTPLSIAFASVATHNHFVLDRGGKVFKQSAPVIKLPPEATEDEHFALLGILNSSTACFWMKQVFYAKASASGDISTEKGRPEANRYDFAGTQLGSFPIPNMAMLDHVTTLTRRLDNLVADRWRFDPEALVAELSTLSRATFQEAEQQYEALTARMVFLQEEIDWETYRLYGLLDSDEPTLTTMDNVGLTPEMRPAFWETDEAPEQVPAELRALFSARRRAIDANPAIKLIETAVYKRLWLGRQGVFGHSTSTYGERVLSALSNRLLAHIEKLSLWEEHRLITASGLAEHLRDDQDFMQVAALFRKRDDFDLTKLVAELTEAECVPYLSALRYKDTGMRRRAAWEETWALQREEDEAEARGVTFTKKILVPPKYTSADFLKGSYWSHRGKLDVPKERFILYPDAERKGEEGPLLGWAGWNEEERCTALYTWITERKDSDGWGKEELTPLLGGVLELLPWLKQWHNEPKPGESEGFGTQIERLFDEDVRSLGLTRDDLLAWRPEKKTRGRKQKA